MGTGKLELPSERRVGDRHAEVVLRGFIKRDSVRPAEVDDGKGHRSGRQKVVEFIVSTEPNPIPEDWFRVVAVGNHARSVECFEPVYPVGTRLEVEIHGRLISMRQDKRSLYQVVSFVYIKRIDFLGLTAEQRKKVDAALEKAKERERCW